MSAYPIIIPERIRTLAIHCPTEQECHCDWRLTLDDCIEGEAMYYVNVANAIVSAISIIVGFMILYHRIIIKGNTLFDGKSGKGCFRPRPVDCLLFFITLFNIFRLVSSLVLVLDLAPSNLIFRSWLYEFPWQFGYGGFALYLIGLAQTLADSHKHISRGWLPSTTFVDILGCWFFFWPFVINNIFSILAGVYAQRDVYTAELFTRLLYILWFLHNVTLTTAVIYAGHRLTTVLNGHLEKFGTTGERYEGIKLGIYRIRMVVVICAICLLTFATFLFLYGILRDFILVNVPGSIFLGSLWAFLGVTTTLVVESVILVK